jgi:hypothetical protein
MSKLALEVKELRRQNRWLKKELVRISSEMLRFDKERILLALERRSIRLEKDQEKENENHPEAP